MSLISLPTVNCQIASIPYEYGFLASPPIYWFSAASSWNAESGTAVSGRYHADVGEYHSVANVKRQDTYKVGTALRSGQSFNVVAGTWNDDLYSAQYHTYSITKPSGAYETTESSVVSSSTFDDIPPAEYIIKRGFPPIILAPAQDLTHSPNTNYCYLHLAYESPDLQDYRVAIEYGQPFRLDVTYDGETWQEGVAIAKSLGNTEKYLAANGNEIRLTVKITPDFKTVSVEIGNGNYLVHTPDVNQLQVFKNITSDNTSDHLLPRNGSIRLAVLNGSVSMSYFPVRHDSIVLNKSPRDFGSNLRNYNSAFVVTNGLSNTDANQTNSATINTDGQKFSYQLTTSMPDAGDGLGSSNAAILSDSALVIPAVWVSSFDDMPDPGAGIIANLPISKMVEVSEIDDVHRCGWAKANLTIDNHFGIYTGSYSNVAVSLATSLDGGGSFYQRITGLTDDRTGGVKLRRADPQRFVDVGVCDKSRVLDVPLGDEVCFDRWALCSAVRYLAEAGNIHPSFISPNLPLYIPPGATADAPYGPAGYDCPYYILGSGSGLTPKFRFYPNDIIWNILQLLAMMSGDVDPVTGAPIPYYFALDETGVLHFESIDFSQQPIVQSYSTLDGTGVGLIEHIEVMNSTADMRTSIVFQGIDSKTFELLHYSLEQPSYVKYAKGFRDIWIERNSLYNSESFLEYTANLAAYQSSLPQQRILMKVPYLPYVYTGNQIIISDDYVLGPSPIYATIKSIKSVMDCNPDGKVSSYSIIEALNVLNTT